MPPATAGRSAAQARERLLAVLEPVVTEAGYDLEDLTVAAAGRRSVVRVIVDRDGGIDLDAVADVSRVVSDALDSGGDAAVAGLAAAYVLEVSSPGVDRPLSVPRHWRRAAGRLVRAEVDGVPRTGRVRSADEHGVKWEVEGRAESVEYPRLGPGRVQVEFARPGAEVDPDEEFDDDLDDDSDEEA